MAVIKSIGKQACAYVIVSLFLLAVTKTNTITFYVKELITSTKSFMKTWKGKEKPARKNTLVYC
jgi:hypothetical protein